MGYTYTVHLQACEKTSAIYDHEYICAIEKMAERLSAICQTWVCRPAHLIDLLWCGWMSCSSHQLMRILHLQSPTA